MNAAEGGTAFLSVQQLQKALFGHFSEMSVTPPLRARAAHHIKHSSSLVRHLRLYHLARPARLSPRCKKPSGFSPLTAMHAVKSWKATLHPGRRGRGKGGGVGGGTVCCVLATGTVSTSKCQRETYAGKAHICLRHCVTKKLVI